MNKSWIKASHSVAKRCRQNSWIADGLDRYEYLDTMGLFETSWITFEHKPNNDDYGYPRQ